MKNIAVFVHSLAVEYALKVIDGISNFFKDKEVRLVIAQTHQPHFQTGIYQYQFWANAELLKSECIDGIIVVSGSYTSGSTPEELRKMLEQYSNKPVFSIGADPNLEGVYYSLCNCEKIYDEVVNHLKNVHGCKNFAYLSANSTGSDEALARFKAYKAALKKHNLKFDENLVYDGKFTRSTIRQSLTEKIKSKEDVKFDALLSANDLMATAAVDFLTELGLSIPEDIKIVGFDNTSHAMMCTPTLSTIDQQISQQGYFGAENLWNVLNGKNISFKNLSNLCEIYRQSCGCIDQGNNNLAYRTGNGIIKHPEKSHSQLLNQYLDTLADLNWIPSLLDMLLLNRTLNSFYDNLQYVLEVTGFEALGIVFYDDPFLVKREDNFIIPNYARMYMYMDIKLKKQDFFEEGIEFSPVKTLSPIIPDADYNGEFMIYPVFSAETQYGYMICKLGKCNYSTANVYLRIISTFILQTYLYTKETKEKKILEHENKKLLDNNSSLNLQTKTDELTKILNRRGFMEYGQQLIDLSIEMETSGIVIFADLDGLKSINDTFGHEIGDIAIATEAQVIKGAFRKSDITGRLSGDEFAVVAPGLSLESMKFIHKKIDDLNEQFSKEKNLSFTLSLSLGSVEFSRNKSDLKDLLVQADKNLYIEKKEKHARKSKNL